MATAHLMNWQDFDGFRAETDLVLMPFGAVEVYGPHLPLGADGIATVGLAELVAERVPAFVAPLIPVGYSAVLDDFPGTLNVRPSSLVAYARDVAESFIGWGMRRVLFLNGHAGNVPYLNELARELARAHGVRCAQIDWWRFIQPLVEDLVEAEILPHGHASEFGTSVMLHLVPQAVKMERATRTPPKLQNRFLDFLRPAAYRQMTDNGLLGDGTKGTAAKGAETLRRAADRIAEFVQSGEFRAG